MKGGEAPREVAALQAGCQDPMEGRSEGQGLDRPYSQEEWLLCNEKEGSWRVALKKESPGLELQQGGALGRAKCQPAFVFKHRTSPGGTCSERREKGRKLEDI